MTSWSNTDAFFSVGWPTIDAKGLAFALSSIDWSAGFAPSATGVLASATGPPVELYLLSGVGLNRLEVPGF